MYWLLFQRSRVWFLASAWRLMTVSIVSGNLTPSSHFHGTAYICTHTHLQTYTHTHIYAHIYTQANMHIHKNRKNLKCSKREKPFPWLANDSNLAYCYQRLLETAPLTHLSLHTSCCICRLVTVHLYPTWLRCSCTPAQCTGWRCLLSDDSGWTEFSPHSFDLENIIFRSWWVLGKQWWT